MNTIAVLVPSFTLEYSIDVLSGIYDYFSDKDVKVIVAQTKFPHSTIGIFDYQYFTSVEFLKAQDVDAYIAAQKDTGAKKTAPDGTSFNTDDFFEAALRRSYGDTTAPVIPEGSAARQEKRKK